MTSTTEFERAYGDGDLICREGDSSTEMFVILSGQVRIHKTTVRGQVELALLEKGNFFGEMGVLEGLPRDATAQAVGRTTVLVMNAGALLVRVRRDPTLAFEMLHRLSGRVRTLNSRLVKSLESGQTPGAAAAHVDGPAGTMLLLTEDRSKERDL